MSAHTIAITKRKCVSCGKPATVVVRNTWNAEIGPYCGPCGGRKVKELQDGEASR